MTDVKYPRYIEGKYILCEARIRNLRSCALLQNEYSHFAGAKSEPAMDLLAFGFNPHLRFGDGQISVFQ